MRPLTLLLASLTAALAAAPDAQAQQVADWNRRISDVHIVHPPGAPPGTWRVEAEIEVNASDAMPAGLDLGLEIRLELNGTPIEVTFQPVVTMGPIQCYSAGQCTVFSPCTYFQLGSLQQFPGVCLQRWETYNNYTELVCKCHKGFTWVAVDWVFNMADVLTLRLVPGPGSVPELISEDDVMSIAVPEHVPGTPFCAGDGSLATACPCANSGAPGQGCGNSQNAAGALLGATGFTEADPLTGTDNVVLHGSGMTATSTAIYLKGSAIDPNGISFGDGVRCAAGTLIRLATKFNVGGASRFPEAGDPSLSVRGATPPGSGLTGAYQVYYRDPASYCGPLTFNISNAVQMVW